MKASTGQRFSVDVGRVVLVLTATWITVVVIGNVADALCALGVLPKSLPIASGNYAQVAQVLGKLSLGVVAAPAFAGVIVLEAASAAFLWAASLRRTPATENLAFGLLLAIFGGFVICDDIAVLYPLEGVHRGLATYVAVLYAVVLLTRSESR